MRTRNLLIAVTLLVAGAVCGRSLQAEDHPARFSVGLDYGATRFSHFSFPGSSIGLTGRGHAAQGRFEWMPLRLPFGTVSVGLGVGFGVSPRAVTLPNDAPTAAELERDSSIESVDRSNVLVSIPVDTYLAYRAQFLPTQVVVPFVRVGPSVTFVRQASNSGAPERSGKFFGVEYAAGLQILLDAIDGSGAKAMRINSGLQNTYLSVEYARTEALGINNADALDLRGDVIRAGLRFQF